MKPTQGRVVLFRDHRPITWPALIVDTYGGDEPENLMVDVTVFTSDGISFHRHVPFCSEPRPFTWAWPPRVGEGART